MSVGSAPLAFSRWLAPHVPEGMSRQAPLGTVAAQCLRAQRRSSPAPTWLATCWPSHATGRPRALKPLPVMPQNAARPAAAFQRGPGAPLTAQRRDSPRPHHSRPIAPNSTRHGFPRGGSHQSPSGVGVHNRALAWPGAHPGHRIGARSELLRQSAGRAPGHRAREG
jgi:hypothetical protein